jgi:Protein of unknown function (DUF3300)
MIHSRKITFAAALLAAIAIPAFAQTPAASAPAPGQAAGQPTSQAAQSQPEYAPLSADELDSLVAPIALYPDALVAQVLGASTFPYEVVAATLWLKDNSNLTGESLAKAVDQQSWDPAVKALTQFPTVLDDLSKNLAWTSTLGEASATQQADVMAAVQRMRAKALAAGNLKSGPEIKVEQQAPQTIVIQPANPQIVYVPVYSPTIVYGAPIVVPGYYYRGPSVAVVSFGGGIVVVGTSYGGCCGWGWSYWGTNWHSHTVIYNRNIYVGNSYWRGGYYGGGYYRPPGYKPGHPGYRPPTYPGYGRPPATTLPAPNPGNRPGNGNGGGNRPGGPGNGNGNGNRPGNGGPSTLPANPGTRPGNGGPTTLPAKPDTRPGNQPSTRPTPQQPSTRPAPQQPSTRPTTQPARTDSFSGSAGGRAQSARGNQSMGAKGGGGGGRRP